MDPPPSPSDQTDDKPYDKSGKGSRSVQELSEASEEPQQQNKRQKGGEVRQPVMLIPTHLKGRTINVYTVGCKGKIKMEDILDQHEIKKSKSVLLDCRKFQGQGAMCSGIMVEAQGCW